MEEKSDDENYYENFRALSETWDCETSDTDGEDTISIPNEEEEENEQSKRKREEDSVNIDESPTKKVSLQEQTNKESESLTTEKVPVELKIEE